MEPILLIDGHNGIYIPNIFYKMCNSQNSYWVWDYEKYSDLEDPESEFYWDAWDELLNNAYLIDPETDIKYYLLQSDDLWAIPEGYNVENFLD